MKVLSLLQPWASLVVLGHKEIETRSWNTKYRGPLLIHASAGIGKVQRQMFLDGLVKQCLREYATLNDRVSTTWSVPRGAIIGQVNLDGALQSECFFTKDHYKDFGCEISEQEKAFGDYSPGRYGWLLSNPVQFPEPIPAKGSLGLWEYNDSIPAGMETKQI